MEIRGINTSRRGILPSLKQFVGERFQKTQGKIRQASVGANGIGFVGFL